MSDVNSKNTFHDEVLIAQGEMWQHGWEDYRMQTHTHTLERLNAEAETHIAV